MAIFRRVPPDGQKGKVSYNSGIVGKIISLAVAEIEGVEMLANKKRGLKLYFEKDGVYADISVRVDYGYNVPEVAFKIQQSVKHNVEAMTKYKVAKVDVYVVDVEFLADRAAD
ncbi:MAG TPA: Asp23/Gls24 family envelope stress response protein [Candidatus Borkfalkia avicola]|uniref:Asp23/Gls24 family envelope stress response protein n=1 Tax=Candidatus Borkfalkia avicola TaxID=2838503 RepID=A0A9D2D5R3_9FIRM|nr:Asp23/Gls24 family envelope stress response protein [Candidatus Borkfalkia avicola]